jgi:Zn-dependent protease
MKKIEKFFTTAEIIQLIIAILGITIIFTYPNFRANFFLYLIIIFVSLSLKQLFHKLFANKLGCMSTFKLWPFGVVIGTITLLLKSSLGFIFTALGYIEIVPYKFGRWGIKVIEMTPSDYARIVLGGLGVNLFLMLFFGIWYTINPLEIFHTISNINGILSFFSLLPIPSLEGGHIFTWSLWVWVILMFFTILILVIV